MSILTLSGSPSASSKSNRLLAHIGEKLTGEGYEVGHLSLRDLPPGPLLSFQLDHPAIAEALARVAEAQAIVLATPVYKASYTGLLKAFLDVLPQDGLVGKTVLPIASGGSLAHFLAVDYALKPVLAALDARHLLGSIYVLDNQIRVDESGIELSQEVTERIDEGVLRLVDSLSSRESIREHRLLLNSIPLS